MEYSFNVSQAGRHTCRVVYRELLTDSQINSIVYRLRRAYPQDQGYRVTCQLVRTVGEEIPIN